MAINSSPMSGQTIRILRQRLGHSQQSFGDLVGVSRVTIGLWERGAVTVSGPTLRLLHLLDMLQPAAKSITPEGPQNRV